MSMPFKLTDTDIVKIAITAVVCTVPAIAITVCRLWIRRGRYWADDAWALLSAIAQVIKFSGTFVRMSKLSTRRTKVAGYYIMSAPFYLVLWFARLSILFSIIRIENSHSRRRNLFIIAILFFIMTCVLEAQLFWVCEPQEPQWRDMNIPHCTLPHQVIVLQLVTDLVSDVILIVAPLRLIRTLSDKRLRRRLTIIFSTCLITTVVSLVHTAFLFVHDKVQETMSAIVEACISLIVCSVPVVVTSLLRHRRANATATTHGESDVQFATKHGRSTTNGESVAVGTTTTTGWANHFRWERDSFSDLEDSGESDISISTVRDSRTVNVEIQLSDMSVDDGKGGLDSALKRDAEDSSPTKVAWQDA